MRKSERIAIRTVRLEEINVILKMFEIPAHAYYNEGKPNCSAGCWRPYPFRIDTVQTIVDTYGDRSEKMKTIHMCANLEEIVARAHKMVDQYQTKAAE